MCTACLSRRRFLTLSAVAAPAALAGCDDPPNLVSDEQAEAMGLEAWDQIRGSVPPSDNRSYQQALDRVSTRLLEASGTPPDGWEILVFADPQANAFALPGGRIGVYEGMFDVAQTEDQLAAIVGHEIGHLSAEHAQKRMSAQIAKNAGLRIVAFFLDFGDVQYAREIAAALGLGVEVGLLLPYSRDQELEADEMGLRTMHRAGFDARQAITLWQRMQAASGNRQPAFLATHPTPASRIREIEQILTTL
jgi:predicted Zn-dependent protease